LDFNFIAIIFNRTPPETKMNPSQNCINLIKEFEGLRLRSYLCPAGIWTIGYGSTRWLDGTPIVQGQQVTMDQAEELLAMDIKRIAERIPELSLNQNQYDAVVSFVYNLGIGAFVNSTLYRKIKNNRMDASIRDEFMRWTKARVKGKLTELRGLVRRRQAEANLYFK
jgi:lysozyme